MEIDTIEKALEEIKRLNLAIEKLTIERRQVWLNFVNTKKPGKEITFKPWEGREMKEISVNDTIYFRGAHENKRHAANFRGWNGNNAVIIWNGMQMQVEKERIYANDKSHK